LGTLDHLVPALINSLTDLLFQLLDVHNSPFPLCPRDGYIPLPRTQTPVEFALNLTVLIDLSTKSSITVHRR
jgi:hypothetical protein